MIVWFRQVVGELDAVWRPVDQPRCGVRFSGYPRRYDGKVVRLRAQCESNFPHKLSQVTPSDAQVEHGARDVLNGFAALPSVRELLLPPALTVDAGRDSECRQQTLNIFNEFLRPRAKPHVRSCPSHTDAAVSIEQALEERSDDVAWCLLD